MKKWWILLAIPAMAICAESNLFIEIEEEAPMIDLAADPFQEDFSLKELAIFDLDENDVRLSLWSDEVLAKDLNEQFNFEDLLNTPLVPCPECIPSKHECAFDLNRLVP